LILLWSGRARFFLHASHLDENVLNTTYADLNSAVDRRHNRSVGLVGRLRSNFVDRGDREFNMVPSKFYNWLSFFAGQCRELTDLLASCKGRWKEEWGRKRVKQGGAMAEGTGKGWRKKKKRIHIPLIWGSFQLFSRGCAYVVVITSFRQIAFLKLE